MSESAANTNHIQFITDLANAICTMPEAIQVESKIDERGVLIELFVAQEDLGRMIGKGGETASAIRTLLRALGAKNNAHYGFKVQSR